MTMKLFDILSRHCRLPGGSKFPFNIFRALILDIFYSVSVFYGIDHCTVLTYVVVKSFLKTHYQV